MCLHWRFNIKHRRLLHRRAKDFENLFHKGATPDVLFRGGTFRITKRMMKASTAHNPIRSDARSHRKQTGGQHCGQADFFQFFGNRSPATCAGASGGW